MKKSVVSKGRGTEAINLDSGKVFDTVPHDTLVSKFEKHVFDRQIIAG